MLCRLIQSTNMMLSDMASHEGACLLLLPQFLTLQEQLANLCSQSLQEMKDTLGARLVVPANEQKITPWG